MNSKFHTHVLSDKFTMERSKNIVRNAAPAAPDRGLRFRVRQLWNALDDHRAWILIGIIGCIALSAWAASIGTARLSAGAEAKSLEADLARLAQRVADAGDVAPRRIEIVQMAGEFQGWQTSRVVFSSALSAALKSLPQNMEIRRLTLQQTFVNGPKEVGLGYFPRFRSNRLTIGGLAHGARYDSALDQYVSILSATGKFGSVFGQIRQSGHMKDPEPQQQGETYEFLLEGLSAERRIDPVGLP